MRQESGLTGHRDVGAASVLGGASFPARFGWMSATWPFVRATASNSGISIRLRVRLLRRLARDDGEVASEWPGVNRVEVSRRAMLLYLRDGRSCRFVALRRTALMRIVDVISAHDVELRRVRNTLGWILRGGS